MMVRKICVVTGSRAEYGLLKNLMQRIKEDPDLELLTLATNMHLSDSHGLTYKNIENDGFIVNSLVDLQLAGDNPADMGLYTGRAFAGLSDSFHRLKPDVIVLLGDRYEILAAAGAALFQKIPVAHIHGGEITEGAFDNAIRHAVTKLSHLHFTANEEYRKRIIQMGEQPGNVYVAGAPGIENILNITTLDRSGFEKKFNFCFRKHNFLVSFHPVTLDDINSGDQFRNLLEVLQRQKDSFFMITRPNSDTGSAEINKLIDEFRNNHADRCRVETNLGQLNYISALKLFDVVIGNSSSGIIEAPSTGTPSVNIGTRQQGRLMAESVINCTHELSDIEAAIQLALDPDFRKMCKSVENPYGMGNTSRYILEILKNTDLKSLINKKFYDIEFNDGAG